MAHTQRSASTRSKLHTCILRALVAEPPCAYLLHWRIGSAAALTAAVPLDDVAAAQIHASRHGIRLRRRPPANWCDHRQLWHRWHRSQLMGRKHAPALLAEQLAAHTDGHDALSAAAAIAMIAPVNRLRLSNRRAARRATLCSHTRRCSTHLGNISAPAGL